MAALFVRGVGLAFQHAGKRFISGGLRAGAKSARTVKKLGRSTADFSTRVPGIANNVRKQVMGVYNPVLQGLRTGADTFYKADQVARGIAMMDIPGVSDRLNKGLNSDQYLGVAGAVGNGINTLNRVDGTVQKVNSTAERILDPGMVQAAQAHLAAPEAGMG